MSPELRREILTVLNAALAAEREACARIAEKEHRRSGLTIAKLIRDRPLWRLPPLAFEIREKRGV